MCPISKAARRRSATRTSCTALSSNLVALDDAEIKYSTVQNWYPGRLQKAVAASIIS